MPSVLQPLQSLGFEMPAPFKDEPMNREFIGPLTGIPLRAAKSSCPNPHIAYKAIQQQLLGGADVHLIAPLSVPSQLPDVETPLQNRLAIWPKRDGGQTTVSVVSSRITRTIHRWVPWFEQIRALAAQVAGSKLPDQQSLLLVPATTTFRLVEHAAKRLECPVTRVQDWGAANTRSAMHSAMDDFLAAWLSESWLSESWLSKAWLPRSCHLQANNENQAIVPTIDISPPLLPLRSNDPTVDALPAVPLRDCWSIQLADVVYALHIRRGGIIEQLLRARLSHPAAPPRSVFLCVGNSLVAADIAEEFESLGAIVWTPEPAFETAIASDTRGLTRRPTHHPDLSISRPKSDNLLSSARTVDVWREDMHDFLVHCTRGRRGAWPNQTEAEFPRQY